MRHREERFKDQPDLDPERLVFIDEIRAFDLRSTWCDATVAVRRGQRLRSGVRLDTGTDYVRRWPASHAWSHRWFDGPINRDAYVVNACCILVPEPSPGDVVVMEDVSSHKVFAAREAIEAMPHFVNSGPTETPSCGY